MTFSKIAFILFLAVYIVIELLFRSYAIDTLGQLYIYSYQLNTFEILARSVSALGFTLFSYNFLRHRFSKKRYKLISFVATYAIFYLLLNIVMDNIHRISTEQQRENAYYINLFKKASIHSPDIASKLPFEIDESDANFKTYHALSSYLYAGSDEIALYARNNQDRLIETISPYYFDPEGIEENIQFFEQPALIDNFIFAKVVTAHLDVRSLPKINFFDLRRLYFGFAYHSYTRMPFRPTIWGFERIPQAERVPDLQEQANAIRESYGGDHDFIQNPNQQMDFGRFRREERYSLFSEEHARQHPEFLYEVSLSLLEHSLRSYRDKLEYDLIELYDEYPLPGVTDRDVHHFSRFHARNASEVEFREAMREVFRDISFQHVNALFEHWKNADEVSNFLNSSLLEEVIYTYDNNLLHPRHLARLFRVRYGRTTNSSLHSPQVLYHRFYYQPTREYHDFLISELDAVIQDFIVDLKDDYEYNVKSAFIPPLVILLLNIALLLNAALLARKILELFVSNRTLLNAFHIITLMLLTVFAGSSKGLDSERYNQFFNEDSQESFSIGYIKKSQVAWFLAKNNLLDGLINVDENPFMIIDRYMSISKAYEEHNGRDIKFEASMYLLSVGELEGMSAPY